MILSISDANVFMLVEHSGGRYFSGKRHLCDSYLNHRLSPIGNDVEMEINPEVSGMRRLLATNEGGCHHRAIDGNKSRTLKDAVTLPS